MGFYVAHKGDMFFYAACKQAQEKIEDVVGEIIDHYPQVEDRVKSFDFNLGEFHKEMVREGHHIEVRAYWAANASFYELYNSICKLL